MKQLRFLNIRGNRMKTRELTGINDLGLGVLFKGKKSDRYICQITGLIREIYGINSKIDGTGKGNDYISYNIYDRTYNPPSIINTGTDVNTTKILNGNYELVTEGGFETISYEEAFASEDLKVEENSKYNELLAQLEKYNELMDINDKTTYRLNESLLKYNDLKDKYSAILVEKTYYENRYNNLLVELTKLIHN